MATQKTLLSFFFLSLSLATLDFTQQGICYTTQPAQACLPSQPTTFTIDDFTTFEPARSNPVSAFVSFRFTEDSNSIIAQCSSINKTKVGVDISTTSTPVVNPQISFTYSGNNLTVVEDYIACSSETDVHATTSLNINKFCYPNYPPSSYGYGTTCLTPTGRQDGLFS